MKIKQQRFNNIESYQLYLNYRYDTQKPVNFNTEKKFIEDELSTIIKNKQPVFFESLLNHYSENVKDNCIFFTLNLLSVISKKTKNDFKDYIDALYNAGISLNLKDHMDYIYTEDSLSFLYSSKRDDIANYLLENKNYPKEFQSLNNYLNKTVYICKDYDRAMYFYNSGFKLPYSDDFFLYIKPKNFSNTLKFVDLYIKEGFIKDKKWLFQKLFLNNSVSYSFNSLVNTINKYEFNVEEYFKDINDARSLKPLFDDKRKIDYLSSKGFNFKKYLEDSLNIQSQYNAVFYNNIMYSLFTHSNKEGVLDYLVDNKIDVIGKFGNKSAYIKSLCEGYVFPKYSHDYFLKAMLLFNEDLRNQSVPYIREFLANHINESLIEKVIVKIIIKERNTLKSQIINNEHSKINNKKRI